MNRDVLPQALVEAGIDSEIKATQDLTGGCIHQVRRIMLVDGSSVVVKFNTASKQLVFDEEMRGLRALAATNTVIVPEPLYAGVLGDVAMLLMTYILESPATDDAWRSFGMDLAALHGRDVGTRYGFDQDNHIGATQQVNTWCDDWVEFMAQHRLGFQIELATKSGLLYEHEVSRIELVVNRLDQWLPRKPRPSLLHGDLWSGNALPTLDQDGAARIAIIDPAISIGDGWADIAMMKLFGGFPASCLETYASRNDDQENLESRLMAYQLYHVLNHVNLFGRGYVSQAMGLVDRLLG
ncbi:MAG: fructosamine kinase family protein [Planctomycetota bacterium]|nr:fructosamine kinase family protein [Planctomycetota bacterium]